MVDGAQITRWLAIAGLSLATAVMFAVSVRGNYLFGYSLGQTEEKRTLFAWANVAADVWKAFGLITVVMLWRHKQRRAAMVGALAWLMCLLSGINSALGIYVQDRAALTGTRDAKHATYKDTERELGEVERRLAQLPKSRSIGEIDAAIQAVLGRAITVGERVRGTVATVSGNCSRIDGRTKVACEELARLREERARASEAETLQTRAGLLRERVIALRNDGGSLTSDPVGEFYAWITRGYLKVRDVGFGIPLFFALLIEVVSAFGPITIARYMELTRPTKADVGAPRLAMASSGLPWPALAASRQGRVVEWMAERAVPAPGVAAVALQTLFADYERWCAAKSLHACSAQDFARQFDQLREMPEVSGKIRRFGDRYFGVRLADGVLNAEGA
jgi:hypothetical protein